MYFSDVINAISVGREPDNILFNPMLRYSKVDRFPISEGMVPVKSFARNSMTSRLVINPISVGMVPMRLLVPKLRNCKFVSNPISVGIVPFSPSRNKSMRVSLVRKLSPNMVTLLIKTWSFASEGLSDGFVVGLGVDGLDDGDALGWCVVGLADGDALGWDVVDPRDGEVDG